MDDDVEVHGRRLRLRIEGPDADRRFNAFIDDVAGGGPLTRHPVRGRSAEDARDRALEVAHNLLGIDRLQELIVGIARDLAPGARVDLTEDAAGIHADLAGSWALGVPFTVERDEVYEEAFDPDALRERVRLHFAAHLRRADK